MLFSRFLPFSTKKWDKLHIVILRSVVRTNQHSCGNENNHCDIILQYMCGDRIRDGTTTSTIPSNPAQCKNLDCNEDRRYGMHEDFYHYHGCRLRSQNYGVFTSDRVSIALEHGMFCRITYQQLFVAGENNKHLQRHDTDKNLVLLIFML